MKSDKVLIAGPWVGEFGWALFAWQAYVRSLSKYFSKTIVVSRPNSKSLYEDFADEFIAFNPPNALADSYFLHNVDTNMLFKQVVRDNKISLDKNTTVLLPRRVGVPPHTHFDEFVSFGSYKIKPEYIKFGGDTEAKYDYLFHIRNRELRKQDNWSLDNWSKLKNLLGSDKIACIGTKKESSHIEGTYDLRDINLKNLLGYISTSKCVFGPSSGPMHLSSLCNTPHVVWSYSGNKTRYTINWNPLCTKVLFLDEYQWHPTPEYVYNSFKKWRNHE